MKKIFWMVFSLAFVGLLYYLFIRPFEFEVNFKTSTLPGDIIETIRIWNKSLDSAKVIEVDSFKRLKQTIVLENRSYIYDWHFMSLNDSVTKVNIQISEPNRSLANKLLIPFTDQPIESDAANIVNRFYDILKEHLKITDVKVKGEAELDSVFCACISMHTDQPEKAYGMMHDYPLLTSFADTYKFRLDGAPMVRVTKWNHSLGQLEFDFCFPMLRMDSLPRINSITYKTFRKEKVLKAEYHGNYITSDRAWYELFHYAEKNGYKINGLPIEYFYNNPNLGIDESEWKAEIYLPIVE